MIEISEVERQKLSEAAWSARDKARVHGPTPVGCAALADDGRIFRRL